MNAAARDDISAFVKAYGGATFPNSAELFRVIEEDSLISAVRYFGTQPCREIAQVYRERAIMVAPDSSNADRDMFEEFSEIATKLAVTPNEACRLWIFQGRTARFSVFEVEESECIAGCLKRGTESDDNKQQKHNKSEMATPRKLSDSFWKLDPGDAIPYDVRF